MFYIKLEADMSLVVTEREPIYRGNNLNGKIIYLLPEQVGEIDTKSACVFLNCIRADGVPDVIVLERMEEMYKGVYLQYTYPITCKLTRFPGEVCTWLEVYSGSAAAPKVSKSGECILHIQDAKNMDDYVCDHQLTAIYQLSRDVAKKADGLDYNEDNGELQLKSGEDKIGNTVIIKGGSGGDGDSSWDDMTDTDEGDGEEYWEPM